MQRRTVTALSVLEAANLADTIALAFETNGLDMDGVEDLHRQLCGIELNFIISNPLIQTSGIVQATRAVKWRQIIVQAVRRVEAVYSAAMAASAAHTRAALAAM